MSLEVAMGFAKGTRTVSSDARRKTLDASRRSVVEAVLSLVDAEAPLVILRAPPGSGKTYLILRAIVLAMHRGRRVAVAAQTNAQADDLCRRMAREFPGVPVVRFAPKDRAEEDLGASVRWSSSELPHGACVVVSTAAKWSFTTIDAPFDLLLVDEAWQMTFSDFMLLGRVAPRFVLVGDPGQIAPVVPIDVSRWETVARPPHRAAPDVLLRDRTLGAHVLSLPVSTRLPSDTAELVRSFYDFHFDAWSAPGERRIESVHGRSRAAEDAAIDRLAERSVSLHTLPTPEDGVAPDEDRELALAAADIVRRLLERRARAVTEAGSTVLTPADIGMVATHRVMNARLSEALGGLSEQVRVDTPERWQGLERKVMIAVHPLSGVVEPAAFDLATGRLCVMASRHSVGLVVLARDHVGETLAEHVPVADQAVGCEDASGRGHAQHETVWHWLEAAGR